jgi:hypothetical protein
MSTQIFKTPIPKQLLISLLDSICLKNEKHYTLNSEVFKKGLFKDIIPKFIEEITQYYHNSKKKYIERKMTYTNFTTIIRQICNFTKITYTSKIKYDKSKYDIIYYLYY